MSLLLATPTGETRDVPNTYEGIKEALDGATLDVVALPDGSCYFVSDTGMLDGLYFNAPASIMAGQALWGPVVLAGPPDAEGETTEPNERARHALASMTEFWGHVLRDAANKGQAILTAADADSIPPPQVIGLTNEQFEAWLRGEWRPDGT